MALADKHVKNVQKTINNKRKLKEILDEKELLEEYEEETEDYHRNQR